MSITLIDNDERTLAEALEEPLSTATRVRVAVAFAKGSGVRALPRLSMLASSGTPVQILAGIDFQLTDLSALQTFAREPSEAKVYLTPDQTGRASFHPKLYVAEGERETTVVVGSSNLTAGGLRDNVEANIMIRGAPDDPAIASVRAFHRRLWNSGFAFAATDRFRDSYEKIQSRRHRIELSLRDEADYAKAHRELKLAVAEAISSAREPGDRQSWLLITKPENYIRNIEGSIWGDEKRRRIEQVRPGDSIYFYITSPLMQVGAMGLVTRELYEDHTLHWQDGRVYPYRFGFAVLLRPPSPVPLRPLIGQLDLFDRRDDPSWGQRLQASMRALTPHDAELLRTALAQADGGAMIAS